MKNWIIPILLIVSVAYMLILLRQLGNTERKWKIAAANVKAYDELLGNSEKKNAAFQLTIDQLKYCKDSVLKELDETRKKLKIKDKNVQSLHQVSSSFTRTDTLVLKDTIFREPTFTMDTTLTDGRWYSVMIGMKYPSMLAIKPTFNSEKHLVVSTKKETVNPPKKFFLFRWFQKKHTVLKVDVVEKNPYVQDENSRYVEILK